VSTYTIGQIAERTGVSASALRDYEGLGLVVPAGRTDAGYRIYDSQTLERLAFIARAKQLGCSLGEITDLVRISDTQSCEPVQRRFHSLVTEKIRQAQSQMAELTELTGQLRAAAAQLGCEPVDGPCDRDCACHAVVTDAGAPVACTLDPHRIPERLSAWQALLDHAVVRTTTPDGALRLVFDEPGLVVDLARLAVSEQDCCAFFSFAITVDAGGLALEVRAPTGAADVVTALFGRGTP
jgi:MerR family copper efflux transcriptional regulator